MTLVESPPSALPLESELAQTRRILVAKLAEFRHALRRRLMLAGAARFVALAIGLAIVMLVADWWFRFEWATRMVILVPALMLLLVLGIRWIVRPLLWSINDLDLVALVERQAPGLSDRVAAVLELPALIGTPGGPSPQLVRSVVQTEIQRLNERHFSDFFNTRYVGWHAAAFGAALVIAALLAITAPHATRLWIARFFLGSNERWPQATYLSLVGLTDGNRMKVARGEPLVLIVDSQRQLEQKNKRWNMPGRGEPLSIASTDPPKLAVPDQVVAEYNGQTQPRRRAEFTRQGASQFRHELPSIVDPLEVRFWGGDDWLGPITIEPVDRPAVGSLVLEAVPPGNSGAPTQRMDSIQSSLAFLPGTKISLRVESTQPLERAELVARSGSAPAMTVENESLALATWDFREASTLDLQLTARDGGLISKPFYLSLGMLTDRAPRVTLRASGVGRRVTPQAQIPLELRAGDDFGIVQCDMEVLYTSPLSETATPPTPAIMQLLRVNDDDPLPTEMASDPTLEVAQSSAAPGGALTLRGRAHDRAAEGSQVGASRAMTFQIVSPEELFLEILVRQRALRAQFAKTVDLANQQAEQLKLTVEPEQLATMSRRHQLITRQVTEVATRLDATVEELRLNRLGLPQSWDLLKEQVITPLKELDRGAMTQLREQLATWPRAEEAAETHREQTKVLQDEALVAMKKILAQMAQWESFVDVMNQLEEIMKIEQEVLNRTQETQRQRTQDVFDE